MLDRTGPEGPAALVLGYWEDAFDTFFHLDWFLGNLPSLRRLRALFLGDINYADDRYEMRAITLRDLTPLLEALPGLEVLGVRGNKELARLRDLDLSGGDLTDTGGEALLAGQQLGHLRSLHLKHHDMTPEVARHFVDELPGVHVDTSDGLEQLVADDGGPVRGIVDDGSPFRDEDSAEWYARRREALTRALAEAARE